MPAIATSFQGSGDEGGNDGQPPTEHQPPLQDNGKEAPVIISKPPAKQQLAERDEKEVSHDYCFFLVYYKVSTLSF